MIGTKTLTLAEEKINNIDSRTILKTVLAVEKRLTKYIEHRTDVVEQLKNK